MINGRPLWCSTRFRMLFSFPQSTSPLTTTTGLVWVVFVATKWFTYIKVSRRSLLFKRIWHPWFISPFCHFIAKKMFLTSEQLQTNSWCYFQGYCSFISSLNWKKNMWTMWSSFSMLGFPHDGSHYKFGGGGSWLADRTMWSTLITCSLNHMTWHH